MLTMTLTPQMTAAQEDKVTRAVKEQGRKLFDFIRKQVPDAETAEDLMQDVFYQFASTMRSAEIESVSAWLYHVARNKIIDWYRRKKAVSLEAAISSSIDDDQENDTGDLITTAMFQESKTPEEELARQMFWDLLDEALDELPREQRDAFVMNELEGMQFKDMSATTGVPVNTLITRKRYAVLYLRGRLRDLYNELSA
jgi:RNA polymerase sigma factor (sigma-70 family)